MDRLRDLAQKHRLRWHRAEDDLIVIPGKRGHIGDWGDGQLYWALALGYRRGRPTAHLKEAAKRDPRLMLYVEGDEEAIFLFDTGDLGWVADRWCVARHLPGPRALSDEQRRKLALVGAGTRIGPGGAFRQC